MALRLKLIAVTLVYLTLYADALAQDTKTLPDPEKISKQTTEGRLVIRYEHASNKQWGYKVPQKDYFHFLPAKSDLTDAPLRVVLHSAGGSGDKVLDYAFKNHDWFHYYGSDDYHFLYLDCRRIWGFTNTAKSSSTTWARMSRSFSHWNPPPMEANPGARH